MARSLTKAVGHRAVLYSLPVNPSAIIPPDSVDCPLCREPARLFCSDRSRDFYRCEQCELISVDPASHLSPEAERANYDLHQNDPADARYRGFLNQLVTPLLARLQPGMEGLDFGCGPGPALSAMLREAGMVMSDYDPLFAPDAALLDRQYDFVTCTEVVEHFNHPATAWPQLAACVRPGGWLGIMTWLVPDLDPEHFRRWGYKGEPSHVSFYRPATMDWLGRELGLHVEQHGERVILMHKPLL